MISVKHVLTAAHCLYKEKAHDITVFLGTSRRCGKGGDEHKVEKLVPHRKYKDNKEAWDIGIVVVRKFHGKYSKKMVENIC